MQNQDMTPLNSTASLDAESDSRIGRLLLQLKKITPADVENIMFTQQKLGLRFGHAAVKLGLVAESDIRLALALQFDSHYLPIAQGSFSSELVAAYQPFSSQVEAMRALRSQLMLRWFSEGHKTLAIVSAAPGEGSSYLAASLAVLFSQLGERTLLVDANFRKPRQHELFKLKESYGLSDILAGRASLDVVTRVDAFADLSVLGAGTVPPNSLELLSQFTFAEFMRQAASQYDVVLVDNTSGALTADAQASVARAGGALLLSRLNHSRLTDVVATKNRILATGAQVVGAVINDF